jgi:hypothetical protein
MAGLTLQQILPQGYAAFERCHPLPDYVRRAAWALLGCRTAVLGGPLQACPAGQVERVWDNTGRHRLCPPCAWLQVARWLAQQKARLLACDHYHVSFPMPDELCGLWLAHVRPMTTLLFATVHETLAALLGDARELGARPGSLAALPPWSRTLGLPPPGHCLVTGGGLTDTGEWRAVRNGVLLPARVGMAVFRGNRLPAMDTALRAGRLTRPGGRARGPWENRRNKRGRRKWKVPIRERYPDGEGGDLSGALSARGPPRQPALGGVGAGRRQLLVPSHWGGAWRRAAGRHDLTARGVPPRRSAPRARSRHPGVRADGLYAPTAPAALTCARAQVGQGPGQAPARLDWQPAGQGRGEAPPEGWAVCGRRLIALGLLLHSRSPPRGRACGGGRMQGGRPRGARGPGEGAAAGPPAAALWSSQATHTARQPSGYMPRPQLAAASELLGKD